MNIGKNEARHLLDVLIYLRKAVAIAGRDSSEIAELKQLALERCVEIADEGLQRAGLVALGQLDESLQLSLSRLRQLISRDYHLVNLKVLQDAATHDFPKLIQKIEPLEKELYEKAGLKKPSTSNLP